MRKTALIYLAAGNSRRFGRNKLLYEVDGRPMYLHLLERLMEIADADKRYELLVVTQYQEIRETVDNFRKEGRRVFCVWSPESRKGVSFSIRAALSHIGKSDRMWTGETSAPVDIRSCAFFVADQPWLTKTTVEGFLAQMADAEIGCVRCGCQEGNPVWFSKAYFSELMELKGDEGGKKVFSRHQNEAVYYEVKSGKELEDIDQLSYNKTQMIKLRTGGRQVKEYLTGIQHVGIPTKDMDATVEFYQKLGFETAYETINEENGARVVFLKLNNLVIETYEEKTVKMEYGSIDHLAIDVTDVEKVYEKICAMGMNNLSDEIHFLPFWENGVRYFKIDGPNKECIEFSQML
nr:NTP transferase domain-containing protein [uncultured Merdimonas sp.]